jgi:hypothetical protein
MVIVKNLIVNNRVINNYKYATIDVKVYVGKIAKPKNVNK